MRAVCRGSVRRRATHCPSSNYCILCTSFAADAQVSAEVVLQTCQAIEQIFARSLCRRSASGFDGRDMDMGFKRRSSQAEQCSPRSLHVLRRAPLRGALRRFRGRSAASAANARSWPVDLRSGLPSCAAEPLPWQRKVAIVASRLASRRKHLGDPRIALRPEPAHVDTTTSAIHADRAAHTSESPPSLATVARRRDRRCASGRRPNANWDLALLGDPARLLGLQRRDCRSRPSRS